MQRIHKTLEDANLKLSSVPSDVTGVSGDAILDALVAGKSHRSGCSPQPGVKAIQRHFP